MFYLFDQNNSGGTFSFFAENGISARVYIEAANGREADERAKSIGIYFDGVVEGRDCPCCGDRWHRQWSDEGMAEAPTKYEGFTKWIKRGPEAYVHPLEGDFYPIPFKKRELFSSSI